MRVPPLWLTVLVFLGLHLILAGVVPLVEDEAYYTLWATIPSFGYYDHPPMIAWWIWLGKAVFGHTAFGVRVVSVLGFAATTVMAWRMTWLITQDRRAADIAALFLNATVMMLALGFTATPDAPSTFFWALTEWAIIEAIYAERAPLSGRWWLLAGVTAGLGVQSKFTNLFLGVGLVLWLIGSTQGRAELRRPVVWAAAGLALLMIAPLGLWNYAHGWVGLGRQFGRVEAQVFAPGYIADYVLTCIALVTPVIFWALARGVSRIPRKADVLIWLTAPLVLYMFYHATHDQVQANWLVPLYPAFAVAAALFAKGLRDRFTFLASATGLAIGALAFALAFFPGTAVFPGHNPPNETKGWTPMIGQVRALKAKTGAAWIATDAYGLTGSLTFYLPDVPVWAMTQEQRYIFRGPIPAALCNAPGLLVTTGDPSAQTLGMFTAHGAPEGLVRRAGTIALDRYVATPVQGLHGPGAPACGAPTP